MGALCWTASKDEPRMCQRRNWPSLHLQSLLVYAPKSASLCRFCSMRRWCRFFSAARTTSGAVAVSFAAAWGHAWPHCIPAVRWPCQSCLCGLSLVTCSWSQRATPRLACCQARSASQRAHRSCRAAARRRLWEEAVETWKLQMLRPSGDCNTMVIDNAVFAQRNLKTGSPLSWRFH